MRLFGDYCFLELRVCQSEARPFSAMQCAEWRR